MKLTRKIVGIGCSQGITIPKPIRENLNINKGDLIEIEIKKIKYPKKE